MNLEEKMTIDERRKYLRVIQKRYCTAKRKEKQSLLDEAEKVTGLHRKSLIRLLRSDLKRQPRQRQRGRTYGIEVQRALMIISESTDYICAERLQPNLVWLAQHLAQHEELEVTSDLLNQLATISISTVRRILQKWAQSQVRLPRKGPREANQVARQVPIRKLAWDEKEPGYFEADLVHHSGPSADGHYVHSLQWIDVRTGWSERVALLGRSYRAMQDAFERILARLPFPIREIHFDNGSEFLNHHLLRFWQSRTEQVKLSRGRPYHKNDQRFVEQKNSTLVRAFFGYERLDTVAHTQWMNLLYDKLWLYYNFFQPVIRLKEKEVVTDAEGSTRLRRRHDVPCTPFDRLVQTGVLSTEAQQEYELLRKKTNPRQLRREIYQMLEQILEIPLATEGKTENVFETLRSTQTS